MPNSTPESNASDAAMVRAAMVGDERAKRDLSDRLHCVDRMLHVRNLRAGRWLDAHELEDLGQEVRAAVWGRLADYREIAPLSAWVYGFCEFHMRNAVRRKQRRPREVELGDVPGRSEEGTPAFYDHVHAGIARLDLLDQRIVRLKHFDGLTLEAIAETLSMKLNTLKSRYFRALNRLRECIRPHVEVGE